MACSVDTFLRIAAAEIGTKEAGVGNTNDVKYNTWFYKKRVSGSQYSWCDVFLAWCADQAGAKDICGHFSYTPSHSNWFKQNKRWFTSPKRGDFVFFDWPKDDVHRVQHIAVVESVNKDGSFVTIEGNAQPGTAGNQSNGGGVYRRTRKHDASVVGFGRPEWTDQRKIVKATTFGALAAAMGVGLSSLLILNPGATETTVAKPGTVVVVPPSSSATASAGGGIVAVPVTPGVTTPQTPVTTPVAVAPVAPAATPRATEANPTISQGDSGKAVGRVQTAAGATRDFNWGPKTTKAVKRLQARSGLVADGVAGPQTWQVVNALTGTGTLQYGSTGDEVKGLQRVLGISPDGTYGRATQRAVEKAQKAAGITVDGKAGPQTRAALIK